MSSKPAILLVPGAWHNPLHYERMLSRLRDAGYATKAVHLASVGGEPLSSFDGDVEVIRAGIQELLAQGNDVLIFVHSYAAFPTSQAMEGLDKPSQQRAGKKNGVVHMFYCCSFIIPENMTFLDAAGGKDPDWWQVSEDRKTITPIRGRELFYNDLDDETAKYYHDQLRPFSYGAVLSKCTYVGWKHVPVTYLYCAKDAALPLEVQKAMVQHSGVHFNEEYIDASHSPFISKPDETAAAVRRAAGEKV